MPVCDRSRNGRFRHRQAGGLPHKTTDNGRLTTENSSMPKWAKTIVAILLLPLCAGAVATLWRVLKATGRADTFWVAMLAGAACWTVIFLLLPKPIRIYVFGHELTHAVWTWIFGGKVKQFKVGSGGGHVVVTTNNFVIALAPYFFPLYVALVVLVFVVGHLLW